MIREIETRRSIRKYKETPVSREQVEQVLRAGILAPSSKNRQPWKFVVTSGSAKNEVLDQMAQGLEREKRVPLIPESRPYIGGAEHTLQIMREAPVVVFIVNPLAADIRQAVSADVRVSEICNAQSVGAAIENMSLEAEALGLGSLWICNTFFAQEELERWLGQKGTLYAAFVLGYADEAPEARPRNEFEEVVEWRGDF